VPEHVNIEISTACNLKCKMCKRETIDFGNQLMPYATFTRIIDRLPKEVKLLSFGGYGEMLLHPKFFDMVSYAKARGFSTQTTSNGTLLADEARMNKLLDSGLDEFRISIDRITPPSQTGEEIGHVFSEKLLKIVGRLSALRKEKKSKIILGINTVVHHNNIHEILPIIEFAQKLELDLVDLIRLDTCANKASRLLLFEKEKELYKSIDRLPKKIKVATPLNRFGGIRKMYHLRKEYCPFRLKGVHIRMNGAVTPCGFGFAAHDFGNILEMDLKKIWEAALFRETRNNDQNPVCKSCSIFKWKPLEIAKQPQP
jgi:Fe-coproporphyrin III synthase